MLPNARSTWIAVALAAGIALVLAFRLSHPLLHTDEITYLSGVLESMGQGTVLPVQGNGALFLNKPPLAFLLMRLSFEALGPSPFAARLPSVLAAAATAGLLFLAGAELSGVAAGALAALIFAFTPGLLEFHALRSATPDSLEILLVTGAILALELWRRQRRFRNLVCLLGLTAAVAWVKSPFSLAVLLIYLLATELPSRRAGRGTPRFGWTFLAVAGAWLVSYGLWLATLSAATSPGAVMQRLFVQQYMRRIEGRVGVPAGPEYYLMGLLRDFGPLLLLPTVAVIAGVAAWLLDRRGRQPSSASRTDALCLAVWALAAPFLATASVSKLPWYTFLSYPGMALLLAVSADRLARGVSSRRSVQALMLAACAIVLFARLPVHRIWPAQAGYRGQAGRLWQIAADDPEIEIQAGPNFNLLRQSAEADREARLYLRMLLWRRGRGPSSPDACRATLVNRRRDIQGPVEPEFVIELHRPARRGPGILLVDDCDGWLVEQLGKPG